MALGGKLDGENLVELRQIPKKHADGAGLYFVVQSSGSAAWAYRYMIGGIAREMGLGGPQRRSDADCACIRNVSLGRADVQGALPIS